MTPADVFRAAATKRSALLDYGARHEHFAEREQILLLEGREAEAADAHEFGLRLLRAWIAEDRDPTPEGLPA